ncbi:MAG: hypothetical protein ACYDAR_01455 [Thermomicrobiales bacterium]
MPTPDDIVMIPRTPTTPLDPLTLLIAEYRAGQAWYHAASPNDGPCAE